MLSNHLSKIAAVHLPSIVDLLILYDSILEFLLLLLSGAKVVDSNSLAELSVDVFQTPTLQYVSGSTTLKPAGCILTFVSGHMKYTKMIWKNVGTMRTKKNLQEMLLKAMGPATRMIKLAR
jgi:hypothetical protein